MKLEKNVLAATAATAATAAGGVGDLFFLIT